MKRFTKLIAFVLLFLTACLYGRQGTGFVWAYEVLQGPTELTYWDKSKTFNGYTLFGYQKNTFLIDMQGRVVHTWPGGWNPHLLSNGHILNLSSTLASPALCEYDWDGNKVWTYVDKRPEYVIHHDFERIFNKKLNAYTTIYVASKNLTNDQCLAAGCDPANAPYNNARADGITEVDMNGNIVWEWNFFDHGVQDLDAGKPNYVGAGKTIADYPGRININLPGWPIGLDWIHANAVDYNDDLDQMVISSRWCEFYVIDHGNTFVPNDPAGSIALAASPTGDFLYRFGDPSKYHQGNPPAVLTDTLHATTGNRQIGGSHQVQWIKPGLPGAGNFLDFNNGEILFEKTPQSYIFEINPYLDINKQNTGTYVNPPDAGYELLVNPDPVDTDKWPKLMSNQIVNIYHAQSNNGFYSNIGAGVQRLPNGNTLIFSQTEGHLFEVTSAGETVWEYINPVTQKYGIAKYRRESPPEMNHVFRAYRYSQDDPAFTGRNLTPGATISGYEPSYYSPAAISAISYPQSTNAVNPVWVTVTAANQAEVRQIQLFYQTNYNNYTLTMADDGAHQDGLANDGVYGAQIPAFAAGTTVWYFVVIENNKGVRTTYPSDAPNWVAGLAGSMYSYTIPGANNLLTATNGSNLNITVGQPVTLTSQTYTLTNNNATGITWTAGASQNWLTLSPISGTLGAGASANISVAYNANAETRPAGNYVSTITYTNTTNQIGNTTQMMLLTVQSAPIQPVLISPGDQQVDEDKTLAIPLAIVNPDCDTITYSMVGTPTGATLDAVSGIFSWHPNYNQAGAHVVTFTASAQLLSGQPPMFADSKTITITVNDVNNPDQASSPQPADGATGVSVTTQLSWFSSPNVFSHDVYLGPASAVPQGGTPPYQANVPSAPNRAEYNPGLLAGNTTYYWEVNAHDNSGQLVAGDIWNFTTAAQPVPGQAANPNPANNATNVPITQTLSWTAGNYAASYNIYFGTSAAGIQLVALGVTLTQYAPPTTLLATAYYWRVDARNNTGTTTGNIWIFTTQSSSPILPAKVTNPVPANNATEVGTSTMLYWNIAAGATSYDIYFGTTTTGWSAITNTAYSQFSPGTLAISTGYYWRIDARNSMGVTNGDTWKFATQSSPPPTNGGSSGGSSSGGKKCGLMGAEVIILMGLIWCFRKKIKPSVRRD